jgi:drug/metabolite transporter (DMT)-like permease
MIKLWICFAILSMIISALSTISLKMIDKSKYDNDIFIILTFIMMGFFSIVYLFLFKNDKNKIIKSCDKQLIFFVILFGLLLIINNLCMQYAMKISPNIGYSHLIINLNVIITLFASYFLFKQKINLQSFFGIIITLFGIAIVVNNSN